MLPWNSITFPSSNLKRRFIQNTFLLIVGFILNSFPHFRRSFNDKSIRTSYDSLTSGHYEEFLNISTYWVELGTHIFMIRFEVKHAILIRAYQNQLMLTRFDSITSIWWKMPCFSRNSLYQVIVFVPVIFANIPLKRKHPVWNDIPVNVILIGAHCAIDFQKLN